MALRDPRNKSRNNASRRTSSSTRSKRATTTAKYNPKPTSSKTRPQTKGTSNKVTTGKGGEIKSKRLKQALNSVKTKRTPAKTPPKTTVKTNPASKTPRGAQGPRTAPQQGPSQRVNTRGLVGSRAKPKPTTKAPPRSATPKASRVGDQIKQAKRVKAANPGRAARAAANKVRKAGGTAAEIKKVLTAANPYAVALTIIAADVKDRKVADGTLKGKPNVPKGTQKTQPSANNYGNYNTRDPDGRIRSRKRVGPKIVGPKIVGPKK